MNIVLPNGTIACFRPVTYWQRNAYLTIKAQLDAWAATYDGHFGNLASNDKAWNLLQQCLSLLPREDCDRMGLDLAELEQYWPILANVLADLDTLNAVDPLLKSAPGKHDPVPSSGDQTADLLADLTAGHGGESAIALLRGVDLNTLNKVLWRLNELARDPAERDTENLMADWVAWKKENKNLYRRSLGMPVYE